ncbi:hypothetical protein HPB52_000264 [Rhipicephalus sanguineus]|uniref:Uncharacterized protein n=1 Tax=Rhipicephalus sanguineus TaxID=34632 RepID=A0A9D4PN66_RHISA|nr:hypothetical protein HPB52_000264 [Rhipicephalus sanguineus]
MNGLAGVNALVWVAVALGGRGARVNDAFLEIEASYRRERAAHVGGWHGGHLFGTPKFARTCTGRMASQSDVQHLANVVNRASLAEILETSSSSSSSSPSGGAVPATEPGQASSLDATEAINVMQAPFAGSTALPPKGIALIGAPDASAPTCAAQVSNRSLMETDQNAGQGSLQEAEASLPIGTRLINVALAAVYPSPSLDAIKGLRRQPRYRVMLAQQSA